MIKIIIPTEGHNKLNDPVADHFGRSRTYTLLNKEGEVLKVIDNTSEHMGGKGLPPELIKKHGVNILLCRELGPRALSLCQKLDIDVYVIKAKTVKEIFSLWKTGRIEKADRQNVCSEHRI